MNHPHGDDLLLLAYGELDGPAAAEVERHLASCLPCREQFVRLERARVAADLAFGRPAPQRLPWAAALGALAAAAILGVVLLRGRPEPATLSLTLPRYAVPELAAIDALLTRLEQERLYAIP